MRTLHFDCFSGASGDMIVGALVDLGVDRGSVRQALAGLDLPGLRLSFRKVRRGGLRATRFRVQVSGAQPPRGLKEIRQLLRESDLSQAVQRTAGKVFHRLCQVEARIHGVPVSKVHLHEVGAVDSIVDVVAAAFCIDQLSPHSITASPIPTGSGTVRCEHGILPVPAPAALALLEGVPIYGGPVEAEMITPTGAAILTTVVGEFGTLPQMKALRTGMGAGSREHPGMPNVLRALEGELQAPHPMRPEVTVVEANIDDMNPQDFGHLMERLLGIGALEVYFTPVQMKKSRPGVLVTALALEEHLEPVCRTILQETTSIGLRYHRAFRRELDREMETVQTRFGKVALKVSRLDGERIQISPEYDDCRRCARRHGVSLEEVRQAALQAHRSRRGEGE